MNFRMIWMGSDDEDDDGQNPLAKRLIPEATSRVRYQELEGVLVRVDAARRGRPRYTPLTNFTARIASDIVLDDGEEGGREFALEASLRGETLAFRVLVVEFGRMNRVLRRLGPQAIVILASRSTLAPRSKRFPVTSSKSVSSRTWAGGSKEGSGFICTREAPWAPMVSCRIYRCNSHLRSRATSCGLPEVSTRRCNPSVRVYAVSVLPRTTSRFRSSPLSIERRSATRTLACFWPARPVCLRPP